MRKNISIDPNKCELVSKENCITIVPKAGYKFVEDESGTVILERSLPTIEYIREKLAGDKKLDINVPSSIRDQLNTIADIMLVQQYLDDGWKPDYIMNTAKSISFGNTPRYMIEIEIKNSLYKVVAKESDCFAPNNTGFNIFFKTKESCECAIEIVGEQRIMDLYWNDKNRNN